MPPAIYYIMGVSGCGKSTVGRQLAERLNLPFFDADDFHSSANLDKMKAGIPLTDEDRSDWLKEVQELASREGRLRGAVIACSALKEKYREQLGEGIELRVNWVFLDGTFELIQSRLRERSGHFMPPDLLASQFESLEPPAYGLRIDINQPPAAILSKILTTFSQGRD